MAGATRREFLKRATATGLAFGLPGLVIGGRRAAGSPGANSQVGVAVMGLGGIDIVGGVGGRGRQLIDRFREVPGARIVALCDVDQAILDHEVQKFKDRNEEVAAYTDIRKVLEDKAVDAVAIAAPNHWHALATIWTCRAGKDVYVEKPFSHDLWEGRQMVAAARKHGRMVQVGTQRRSSKALRQAFEYLRSGQLGAIRCAYAIVYRAREGIGQVDGPTPVPSTVDYDLWCGPAPTGPLMRRQLHYEWHWFWATGNGEIGNNGAHMIDLARWALGQDKPAPRAMSIGGRLGFEDCGETPNTHVAILDYQPAPLICEIRNYRQTEGVDSLGRFRGTGRGIVIDCEGGYLVGGFSAPTAFDHEDRQIKQFQSDGKPRETEIAHVANFIAAVRARNADELRAEALEGHLSAAGSHMSNVSHRLGREAPPEAILETIRGNRELSDAFERCREYLRENGIDLDATRATVGPWVTFDSGQDRFVGEFAGRANELSQRDYRKPFVVPEVS
jgi:predicted dehydrogenase